MSDSKVTVLIAEDEGFIRRLLQKILERAGYNVLAAEDGQEALLIAKEHENGIDMLISDIHMPRMTGLELAAEIKRFMPKLGVLLVSGYSPSLLRLEANWSFLEKPYSPRTILDKVRQIMNDAPLPDTNGAPGG